MRFAALLVLLAAAACAGHPAVAGSCTPDTCAYEPDCGDGVCSPEESWQSCPADCPKESGTTPESCNGRDDDGDGIVDEGDPGGGGACQTDLPGACAAGVLHCVGGRATCQAQVQPRSEAGPCNGIDDDCNGKVDDGCGDGPVLLTPGAGAYTGSFRAPAKARTLRPAFTWNKVDGADSYELQLDDSCPPGNVQTCAFPSPELTMKVTFELAVPEFNLPVSTAAPGGRFYVWRVRACTGDTCSAWSAPRGLHVGQLPDDFDGDGYSDALLPAPSANELNVQYHGYVGAVEGSALGVTQLGMSVATGRDVDGDGFSDAVVGARAAGSKGSVYVIYGGPGGLSLSRFVGVGGTKAVDDGWGAAVAGVGDLDGDGFDDIAVGAPDDKGSVTILANTSQGLVSKAPVPGQASGDHLGSSLAPAYPLGGGAGVAAGAPGWPAGAGKGEVFLMAGSSTGATGLSDPYARYENPDPMTREFGSVLASTPRGHYGSGAYAISARVGSDPDRVFVCGGAPEEPGPCEELQTSNGGASLTFFSFGTPADMLFIGSPDRNTGPMDDGGWVGMFTVGSDWTAQTSVTGIEGPRSRFGAALAVGDYNALGTDQLLVGVPGASKAYVYTVDGMTLKLGRLAILDIPGIGAPLALLTSPWMPGRFQ